jgi:undecaprenyl diphosphate synthase
MNKLNHVAFIMDGNGRWGEKKKRGRNYGHLKGIETVKKIVKSSIVLKIPIITFYVFSSENWKRPKKEVNFLFNLIKVYFSKEIDKIIVNLAINYGSKNEIFNALRKTKKKLNIKNFEKNLYTKNLPDPDLLIRTGGHHRLSNFMLWQLAYSELVFLNKLWPDFNSYDLVKIIKKYKTGKRNFGGI